MYRAISSIRFNTLKSVKNHISLFNRDVGILSISAFQEDLMHVDIHPKHSRHLFTDSALGLEKLDRIRYRKGQLLTGQSKDRYLERIDSFFKEGRTESIIKDDLINLIGIADNDEQLNLLERVVCCTGNNQEDLIDGWGAALMRLYYKMNKIERALENVKNTDRFGAFFNHRICYKIMMTMLYDAQRYSDVLEMYHFSERRLTERPDIDKNANLYDLVTLTFAALAKMNDSEALKIAENLYSQLSRKSMQKPSLRPTTFLAYLAVNNNQPTFALNLISNFRGANYISLRELKIISLIKLERYEDIVLQLREFSSSIRRNSTILLRSTLKLVEDTTNKIEDGDLRQELKDILVELESGGHISDATIEELIFKPITQDRPGPFQDNFSSRRDYTNNRQRNSNSRGFYDRQHDPHQFEDGQRQRKRNDNRGRELGGGGKFIYQNVNLEQSS